MSVRLFYLPPHRLPVPAHQFIPEDVVLDRLPKSSVVLVSGENLVPFTEYIKIIAATRRVAIATRAVIDEMRSFVPFVDLVIAFPPTLLEINSAVGWLVAGGAPLRELVARDWNEDLVYSVCAVPPELVRAMRKKR